MSRRYVNFRDRAPFVNQDRIQESRAAKQEAKADAESRQRRKAQNRRAQEQRKLQAVCPDELWSHYQAECEKHGMTLRRGSSTKPIHWMFEDAETGARLLNYYPKRKTGCFARGKGFHVGDINAAIDLASKQSHSDAALVRAADVLEEVGMPTAAERVRALAALDTGKAEEYVDMAVKCGIEAERQKIVMELRLQFEIKRRMERMEDKLAYELALASIGTSGMTTQGYRTFWG